MDLIGHQQHMLYQREINATKLDFKSVGGLSAVCISSKSEMLAFLFRLYCIYSSKMISIETLGIKFHVMIIKLG